MSGKSQQYVDGLRRATEETRIVIKDTRIPGSDDRNQQEAPTGAVGTRRIQSFGVLVCATGRW